MKLSVLKLAAPLLFVAGLITAAVVQPVGAAKPAGCPRTQFGTIDHSQVFGLKGTTHPLCTVTN